MQIVIVEDERAVGRAAAGLVREVVERNPMAVLGLATGSSPLPVYRALAEGGANLSGVTGFALDEYVGIPREHPQSYLQVLLREFAAPLGVPPESIHVPDGRAADLALACADYERAIAAAGGVDLQLLGIGANGHVGFNEPSSSLASRTRVEVLAQTTRGDNARFFSRPDEVPRRCVTQGLGTILEARSLVLVAVGERKAEIVARAIEGPLSSACPASILQLHPAATVVLDEAAASRLALADYYRQAYALS